MNAFTAQHPIRAVTFDVGGTLIRPWPSVGHIYAEVATRLGSIDLDPAQLNERFSRAWRSCVDFDYTRAAWEKVVDQTFAGLIAPSVKIFPELYDRFAEADAWKVFDDVVGTLDQLASAGIKLAIISNWDERLRGLLQRLHLNHCFETIVISCEVGFAKPSPVIFEQAATRLGLPANSILHVGDSLEMDKEGAENAGFKSLHLRRETPRVLPGEVNSLAEVIMQAAGD